MKTIRDELHDDFTQTDRKGTTTVGLREGLLRIVNSTPTEHWMSWGKLAPIVQEYKHLPNLEKIRYVNLANSVTSDEIDFVRRSIAPIFECGMPKNDAFEGAHEFFSLQELLRVLSCEK